MDSENQNLPTFSLVVPVRDQKAGLQALHRQLTEEIRRHDESYELVFVDDGSSDQTATALRRLGETDYHVRLVELSGQFGSAAAVTAGCHLATGRAVVTFDRPCEDWPDVLARLVGPWREGYEIVHGGPAEESPVAAHGLTARLRRFHGVADPPDRSADMRLIARPAVEAMCTSGRGPTVDRQIHAIGFRQRTVAGSDRPAPSDTPAPHVSAGGRFWPRAFPVSAALTALGLAAYVLLVVLLVIGVDAGAELRLTVLLLAVGGLQVALTAWRLQGLRRKVGRRRRAGPAYVIRQTAGFDRAADASVGGAEERETGGYVVYT